MESTHQYSEKESLQIQLKSITDKFDVAVKKDVQLRELKILFHEMKELQIKLDALENRNSNPLKG